MTTSEDPVSRAREAFDRELDEYMVEWEESIKETMEGGGDKQGKRPAEGSNPSPRKRKKGRGKK